MKKDLLRMIKKQNKGTKKVPTGTDIRLITPYTSYLSWRGINDMQIDPGLTVTSFELVEKMGRKSMSQWGSEIKTTAGSADFVLLAK